MLGVSGAVQIADYGVGTGNQTTFGRGGNDSGPAGIFGFGLITCPQASCPCRPRLG